jgi:hypothetical protein
MLKNIKKPLILISSLGIIVSLIAGISVEAISAQSGKYESVLGNEKTVGKIKYNDNTKIKDSFSDLQILQENGVTISNITSKFKNGSEEITEFIIGDSIKLGLDKLKSNSKTKRHEFIQKKSKNSSRNKR